MPRFAPEAYSKNLELLDAFGALAAQSGCTKTQLALAWLLQRDDRVIPIPGTTSVEHLRENLSAATVSLTNEQMVRVDALINQRTVIGARYSPAVESEIDTENFY
jgi:aryl-alcohol dehydrogenase-like predicted oxidoreductase